VEIKEDDDCSGINDEANDEPSNEYENDTENEEGLSYYFHYITILPLPETVDSLSQTTYNTGFKRPQNTQGIPTHIIDCLKNMKNSTSVLNCIKVCGLLKTAFINRVVDCSNAYAENGGERDQSLREKTIDAICFFSFFFYLIHLFLIISFANRIKEIFLEFTLHVLVKAASSPRLLVSFTL
jgi:hypothetical protein